jgi:hypothetical protein
MIEIYGGLFTMIVTILGAMLVAIACIYFLHLEFKNIKFNHDGDKGYT